MTERCTCCHCRVYGPGIAPRERPPAEPPQLSEEDTARLLALLESLWQRYPLKSALDASSVPTPGPWSTSSADPSPGDDKA